MMILSLYIVKDHRHYEQLNSVKNTQLFLFQIRVMYTGIVCSNTTTY